MQRDPDISDDPKDHSRDTKPDSKAGFLMIRVRSGDELQVGEATVCFNEISMGYAKIGIKAPRSVKVERKK